MRSAFARNETQPKLNLLDDQPWLPVEDLSGSSARNDFMAASSMDEQTPPTDPTMAWRVRGGDPEVVRDLRH